MIEFRKYNNVAGIYKWENKINHKCYIGQSINLGSRLRHHVNNFKHRRYDSPLYRAFDKYGIESFDVEILYSIENPTPDAKLLLDQLEIGYIETYNSYGKNGYNQTRGGDAGILGYKFTEEQRNVTSINSRKAAKKYSTKVYLYNLDTKWTFSFPSIMSAANHLNCSHGQITRLCRWKQLTLCKLWVGSLDESTLKERAEFVKEYSPNYCNKTGKVRKRPTPGLKRRFNTPDGKKIISESQKEKIRNSLYKYSIEMYKDDVLVGIYANTNEINDKVFNYKNQHNVIHSIQTYIKRGWKYKGLYTFKLINKK